jgi:hypothetical protein
MKIKVFWDMTPCLLGNFVTDFSEELAAYRLIRSLK